MAKGRLAAPTELGRAGGSVLKLVAGKLKSGLKLAVGFVIEADVQK